MSSFVRSLDVEALIKWDASHPGSAVSTLFEHWCLPGEKAVGDRVLRLAVRDGYLNFYIKGQSVAKLSAGRNGPRLEVHEAYVTGRRRDRSAAGAEPSAQRYIKFEADVLGDGKTASLVTGWIATAETYASAEKRFVDDLVAATPGVIDLEMGLPAGDVSGERVAPRMDIVVAQLDDGKTPSLCFWEAKCANNPEVRAQGEPRVIGQLTKYITWMEQSGRVDEVKSAYRNTGAILLKLSNHFRPDASHAGCIGHWEAIAGSPSPDIVVSPGLVIGNYWPEGHTEQIASGRMAQAAASFARNRHRDKLQAAGIFVHEVAGDDLAARTLPSLHMAANTR